MIGWLALSALFSLVVDETAVGSRIFNELCLSLPIAHFVYGKVLDYRFDVAQTLSLSSLPAFYLGCVVSDLPPLW
jgi:hypothetical protein